MKLHEMTFGIVGLGIMGGSLAKSIRTNILSMSNSTGRILACNRSVSSLEMAKSEGVIDEGYASDCVEKMLPECDLVYVCLYPHATLEFLEKFLCVNLSYDVDFNYNEVHVTVDDYYEYQTLRRKIFDHCCIA